MEITAQGKVYLLYSPGPIAWSAFDYGGMFRVKNLKVLTQGIPNADLEFLRGLTFEALERGDLIFCKIASGGYDEDEVSNDDEINSEVMIDALSKLLQIEIPPHNYVKNPNGITVDLAFQPLRSGEVLLLFQPYCDADDNEESLISARVTVPARRSGENEPPPLAKPASISMFEVMVIFCCKTD
ncbi:MAG: hypothetical protein HYT47_00040 [Candidatus Vogelbacteria bacterium]|nr:hypothetical protein [Candidatus Vogelbacteria bacterium]